LSFRSMVWVSADVLCVIFHNAIFAVSLSPESLYAYKVRE
jgi:hypothetical protein